MREGWRGRERAGESRYLSGENRGGDVKEKEGRSDWRKDDVKEQEGREQSGGGRGRGRGRGKAYYSKSKERNTALGGPMRGANEGGGNEEGADGGRNKALTTKRIEVNKENGNKRGQGTLRKWKRENSGE